MPIAVTRRLGLSAGLAFVALLIGRDVSAAQSRRALHPRRDVGGHHRRTSAARSKGCTAVVMSGGRVQGMRCLNRLQGKR